MKAFDRISLFIAVSVLFATAVPQPNGSFFAEETTPAAVTPIDYYVAPNGLDEGDGSADAPFLTLTRARDQIRADKKAGKTGRWTVRIAPGEYPLTEPILFGPEDSGTPENPILYRGEGPVENRSAAEDVKPNRPVFTGGIEIDGWKKEGKFWFAELPKHEGRPLYFEQLFVNDQRAVRARWPNEGFLHVVEARDETPIDRDKKIYPSVTNQFLTAQPGDLAFLKEVPADEWKFAQVVVHHHWDTTRRILLGADFEKDILSFRGGPQKPHNAWRKDSLFYVENVRTAFDRPGEWFYDGAAGRVYYYPRSGEKLHSSHFIVPRNSFVHFLKIAGTAKQSGGTENERGEKAEPTAAVPVTDMIFENLTFSHSDTPRNPGLIRQSQIDESIVGPADLVGPSQFEPAQAAFYTRSVIEADRARRIIFRDCEISHVGEYALAMTDVRECRVERCELFDLGAGGIRLSGSGGSGPDKDANRSEYNVIDNNYIHQGGRFHASAVGIWIGSNTLDNEITHNDIYDFFYTGVSAGWTWGYEGGVAYRNRIEFNRIHKIGQYALADMGGVYTLGTSHGTRVCNNVIFDIKSCAYGGWGLYTDEGSEGITMENNLVYDTTDGSFHQHYGRGNLIRNNILVDSKPIQVAATRVENHLSFTFEKNLIVWSEGNALGYNFDKVFAAIRDNLWFCSTGPALFRDKTHDELTSRGFDVGGIVADPLFVDPARHDYRLRPDSPAFKLGFVPFDYDRAGLYGDFASKMKKGE